MSRALILKQNGKKTTVGSLAPHPLISASPSVSQTHPQKSQGPMLLYPAQGSPTQAVPRFWSNPEGKRNFCTSEHHSRFCPCFCSLNFLLRLLAWLLIRAVFLLVKYFPFRGLYEVLVKLVGSGERMPGLEFISLALLNTECEP